MEWALHVRLYGNLRAQGRYGSRVLSRVARWAGLREEPAVLGMRTGAFSSQLQKQLMDPEIVIKLRMKRQRQLIPVSCGHDVAVNLGQDFDTV